MSHVIGGIILLVIIGGGAGLLFARESARAWDAIRPGTRPTRRQALDWSAARARSAMSAARAQAVRARPSGFRSMRVRGMVLDDPGGTAAGPSPSGPDASPGQPAASAPAPSPSPAPEPPAPAPQPAKKPDEILTGTVVPKAPASQRPPAAPAPPNGRTSTVATETAPPLAEDITAAYARIGATVTTGNINVKIAAYAAMSEACEAAAAVLRAIAMSLEEESLYGPEITEPAAALAAYQDACARSAADVEEQLRSLANTTVGEMPASRHQAPDRRELAESGGR